MTLHSGARSPALILALGAFSLALVGCQEERQAAETPPRPIKSYTVSEAAGSMIRRFSGVAEASETTALSFPVAGTVAEIPVSVGGSVEEGDVVARLDPEPFELDVQAAKAEVEKAGADVAAKEGELERNRTLFAKGWVSQAAIEQHQAAYDAAVSTLEYSRSRLALAQRNLTNATLTAPYRGTIASRPVERFEDVAAAQPIVTMNATAGLVVVFSVPESGINRINLGQPVQASFSVFDGGVVEGRITEIETTASAGNAYRIKAGLTDPPDEVRPGMTAEISVTDPAGGPDAGFFVPLTAIAPGDGENVGSVFKYDADAGIVRQVPIRAYGVRDNLIIVQEGIAPGDVIASAGVSFLRDGQPVRLLEE